MKIGSLDKYNREMHNKVLQIFVVYYDYQSLTIASNRESIVNSIEGRSPDL